MNKQSKIVILKMVALDHKSKEYNWNDSVYSYITFCIRKWNRQHRDQADQIIQNIFELGLTDFEIKSLKYKYFPQKKEGIRNDSQKQYYMLSEKTPYPCGRG